MSIEAISAARKLQIPPTEKFVLIALSDFANDKGEAWPGQSTLADWTCLSRSAINTALANLERAGVITSRQTYREDGGKSVKVYRLVFLDTPHVAVRDMPHVAQDDIPMSPMATTPRSPGRQPHVAQDDSKNPQSLTPSKEPKTNRRDTPKPKTEINHEFDPTTVELPPTFDRALFVDFCTTRLTRKAASGKPDPRPMSELALKQFITRHKHHTKPVLDDMFRAAIFSNWLDLYPPKPAAPPRATAVEQATDLLAHLERTRS